MLAAHYQLMAQFNAWVNRTIYDATAALGDAECRKTRPEAYFGSIHNTLNHLLVVDRLWFTRIEGKPPPALKLNQILYDDAGELRAARAQEDARIVALVDGFAEDDLATSITYKDTFGKPWTMLRWHMLSTVFNHQTHHRGQIHAMIKEAGAEPPPMDVPVYLRSLK